nr:copia protein [Tanacetum cinerariifolium]
MFSVCLCTRFQEAPKTSHLEAVKRIFRYIKGTTHLGLWYPKGTSIETVIYANSDHVGDYVDRKSTSGLCTFVGCCLTSWFSKKQTALAISTIEAEYVSAEKACQQALWMKQALIDYDVRLDDVPIMELVDIVKSRVGYSESGAWRRGHVYPAHSGSETISQTDGAQSSRVPIPLPDDPYMAVRQAYLATITDSESEPFEDFRETKIPKPLPIASSSIPPSDDPYLIVGQAHTPATINTKSEPEEAPLETEELQPIATRITPPSSDHTPTLSYPTSVSPITNEETAHMVVHTQPVMSPGLSARVTEVITLSHSSFHKRYRSSYVTPSSLASPAPSPTLPIRKRYRSTSELVEDTKTEGEEVAHEGQQRQATLVKVTTADRSLRLGYTATRHRALELAEEISPSTFEIGQSSRSMPDQQVANETPTPRKPARTTWIDPQNGLVYLDIKVDPLSCALVQTSASPEWSSGFLPVSPASLTVPSPVASPVTTPTTTIAIDEDEFLERVMVGIPQSCLIGRGRLERRFTPSVSGMEA